MDTNKNIDGNIKNKKGESFAAALAVFSTIALVASHVIAAIAVFSNTKLWLFLVALLVPVIGDGVSIATLVRVRCFWPFILYGVSIVLYVIAQIMAHKIDQSS